MSALRPPDAPTGAQRSVLEEWGEMFGGVDLSLLDKLSATDSDDIASERNALTARCVEIMCQSDYAKAMHFSNEYLEATAHALIDAAVAARQSSRTTAASSNKSDTTGKDMNKNTNDEPRVSRGCCGGLTADKSMLIFTIIYWLGAAATAGYYFYAFRTSPLFAVLGYWICFAKFFAGVIYYNCIVVFLPVCNGLVTLLQARRTTRLLVPVARLFVFHKIAAISIVVAGLGHSAMHMAGTFRILQNFPCPSSAILPPDNSGFVGPGIAEANTNVHTEAVSAAMTPLSVTRTGASEAAVNIGRTMGVMGAALSYLQLQQQFQAQHQTGHLWQPQSYVSVVHMLQHDNVDAGAHLRANSHLQPQSQFVTSTAYVHPQLINSQLHTLSCSGNNAGACSAGVRHAFATLASTEANANAHNREASVRNTESAGAGVALPQSEATTDASSKTVVGADSHSAAPAPVHDPPFCGLTYWELLFKSLPGLTGVLLWVCFSAILLTSTERFRAKNFDTFFIVHQLFILIVILLCMHGFQGWVQKPHAWRYLLCSVLIYGIDRIVRFVQAKLSHRFVARRARVIDIPIVSNERSATSSDSTSAKNTTTYESFIEFEMARPCPPARLFNFKAGQYVQVQVPSVSAAWHPFTISSSPLDQRSVTLTIKVAGRWTRSLSELVRARVTLAARGPSASTAIDANPAVSAVNASGKSINNCNDIGNNNNSKLTSLVGSSLRVDFNSVNNNGGVNSAGASDRNNISESSSVSYAARATKWVSMEDVIVSVNGPLGAPTTEVQSILRGHSSADECVMVAGGIGVTPFASVLESLAQMLRVMPTPMPDELCEVNNNVNNSGNGNTGNNTVIESSGACDNARPATQNNSDFALSPVGSDAEAPRNIDMSLKNTKNISVDCDNNEDHDCAEDGDNMSDGGASDGFEVSISRLSDGAQEAVDALRRVRSNINNNNNTAQPLPPPPVPQGPTEPVSPSAAASSLSPVFVKGAGAARPAPKVIASLSVTGFNTNNGAPATPLATRAPPASLSVSQLLPQSNSLEQCGDDTAVLAAPRLLSHPSHEASSALLAATPVNNCSVNSNIAAEDEAKASAAIAVAVAPTPLAGSHVMTPYGGVRGRSMRGTLASLQAHINNDNSLNADGNNANNDDTGLVANASPVVALLTNAAKHTVRESVTSGCNGAAENSSTGATAGATARLSTPRLNPTPPGTGASTSVNGGCGCGSARDDMGCCPHYCERRAPTLSAASAAAAASSAAAATTTALTGVANNVTTSRPQSPSAAATHDGAALTRAESAWALHTNETHSPTDGSSVCRVRAHTAAMMMQPRPQEQHSLRQQHSWDAVANFVSHTLTNAATNNFVAPPRANSSSSLAPASCSASAAAAASVAEARAAFAATVSSYARSRDPAVGSALQFALQLLMTSLTRPTPFPQSAPFGPQINASPKLHLVWAVRSLRHAALFHGPLNRLVVASDLSLHSDGLLQAAHNGSNTGSEGALAEAALLAPFITRVRMCVSLFISCPKLRALAMNPMPWLREQSKHIVQQQQQYFAQRHSVAVQGSVAAGNGNRASYLGTNNITNGNGLVYSSSSSSSSSCSSDGSSAMTGAALSLALTSSSQYTANVTLSQHSGAGSQALSQLQWPPAAPRSARMSLRTPAALPPAAPTPTNANANSNHAISAALFANADGNGNVGPATPKPPRPLPSARGRGPSGWTHASSSTGNNSSTNANISGLALTRGFSYAGAVSPNPRLYRQIAPTPRTGSITANAAATTSLGAGLTAGTVDNSNASSYGGAYSQIGGNSTHSHFDGAQSGWSQLPSQQKQQWARDAHAAFPYSDPASLLLLHGQYLVAPLLAGKNGSTDIVVTSGKHAHSERASVDAVDKRVPQRQGTWLVHFERPSQAYFTHVFTQAQLANAAISNNNNMEHRDFNAVAAALGSASTNLSNAYAQQRGRRTVEVGAYCCCPPALSEAVEAAAAEAMAVVAAQQRNASTNNTNSAHNNSQNNGLSVRCVKELF